MACAFLTSCAHATFTGAGIGSRPAVYVTSTSLNPHPNAFAGRVVSPVSAAASMSAGIKFVQLPGIRNAADASHAGSSYIHSPRRGTAYRARADTMAEDAGDTT